MSCKEGSRLVKVLVVEVGRLLLFEDDQQRLSDGACNDVRCIEGTAGAVDSHTTTITWSLSNTPSSCSLLLLPLLLWFGLYLWLCRLCRLARRSLGAVQKVPLPTYVCFVLRSSRARPVSAADNDPEMARRPVDPRTTVGRFCHPSNPKILPPPFGSSCRRIPSVQEERHPILKT